MYLELDLFLSKRNVRPHTKKSLERVKVAAGTAGRRHKSNILNSVPKGAQIE